jgi:zinc transport system ATP-binding protein
MNNILELKNITVQFWENTVLNNISFIINKWDIVSLIWKNGTWKSTLLKTIVWINKNYSWDIIKHYKNIWYVPQKLSFDTTVPLTVNEFFSIYHNGHNHDIEKYLKIFDASSLSQKQISNLSWGELQKILIVNSLLDNPDFLILDEPTAWIDTIWEEMFYWIIHEIRKNFSDIAILIVSHNMKMVYSQSNKIVCLHQNCYCTGTPEEIQNNSEFWSVFWDYVIPYKHTHSHEHIHNNSHN